MAAPNVYASYLRSLAANVPTIPSPSTPTSAPADVVSHPDKVLGMPAPPTGPVTPQMFGQATSQAVASAASPSMAGTGSPTPSPMAGMGGSFNGSYTPAQTGSGTRDQFARDLLARFGYQPTAANMTALTAWMRAEGGGFGNKAAYNPLNTTLKMPGSYGINDNNGHPVQAYTSYQQGLEATYRTLAAGYYNAVRQALQAGADPYAVARAVAASPWGTGAGVLRVLGAGGGAPAPVPSRGALATVLPADVAAVLDPPKKNPTTRKAAV